MRRGLLRLLALGRALRRRPRVRMLGELSLALAPAVVAELLATVCALRAACVAVVTVEQQVDLAIDVADRA